MKKTLISLLSFVLVLTVVLTGTVFAQKAADANGDTQNIGVVPKAPETHPIQVDGEMDLVYTQSPVVVIDLYSVTTSGIFTIAFARFAWGEYNGVKSLYCHVIVNDVETSPADPIQPWKSDSVELFIDWDNTATQNWGIDGIRGDGVLGRGLQYRISSQGEPSCGLAEEEPAVGGSAILNTYRWDGEKLANGYSSLLINESVNVFGWHSIVDDSNLNDGWAATFTNEGYMVEFKMDNANLAAGGEIGFDFQINDRYNGGAKQDLTYYRSKYRGKAPETPKVANNSAYYDYFTLSGTISANDRVLSQTELENMENGIVEATSRATTTAATLRTTTKKVTVNRVHTWDETQPGAQGGQGGGQQGGGQGGGQQGGGQTTTNQGGGSGSGCGSSIAIGSGVAMVAMIGAAGFFAFRRKED